MSGTTLTRCTSSTVLAYTCKDLEETGSRDRDITVIGCKTQLVWSRYSLPFLWGCLLNPWFESGCLGGMASWGKFFIPKPSNSSSSCDAERYFAAVICFSLVAHGLSDRKVIRAYRLAAKMCCASMSLWWSAWTKDTFFIFWLHTGWRLLGFRLF